MKPNKLIMCGFGPYAKEVIIDFDTFGDKGIFLITGDTGAGKTTIFDGMCYALYGEASGGKERRDVKGFRSDYATSSDPTYVEFTFTHKNKKYVIRRNPEYKRAANRGTGEVTEPAKVEFSCGDEFCLTKVKDVEAKVIEVLGLTRDQFAQTVMIAQNDFLKILKATTDERKNLFTKLFHTDRFSDLEDAVKKDAAELAAEKEEIERNISNQLLNIKTDANFSKNIELNSIKDNLTFVDNTIVLVEELIEELKQVKSSYEKNKDELNKIAQDKHAIYVNANNLNKDITTYNNKLLEKDNLDKKSSDIKAKQDLFDRIQKALYMYKDYQKVEEASRYLEQAQKDLKKSQDDLNQNKQELENINKNKKSIEENYNKIDELRNKKTSIETSITILNEYNKYLTDHNKCKKELETAIIEYKNKTNNYTQIRADFYASQAGILAEELEDGKPCPVCGSTHHPSKAIKTSSTISKEVLAQAEVDANKARTKMDTLSEREKALLESMNTSKQKLAEQDIDENVDVENLKKEIRTISLLIEKYDDDYQDFVKKFNKYTTLIENGEKDIITKDYLVKDKDTKLKEANNILSRSLKDNDFIDKADFLNVYAQASIGNNLNEEINEYITKRETTINAINDLKPKVDGKTLVDENELFRDYQMAKTQEDDAIRTIKDLESIIKSNNDLLPKLKQNVKIRKEITEKYTLVNDISRCLNGTMAQNVRFSFETYVQQYYFKQVIQAANNRFISLSSGQYTLRCKQEAKRLNTQFGLDLEVYSRDTGKWRDVSSLSGGESFIASLCLALGLSDVVQSKSGNIRLDSMFIDEGFGTLDETILKLAMDALANLASGNRLIGIISHVSELKNRIDQQIVITKTNNGSNVEIVK